MSISQIAQRVAHRSAQFENRAMERMASATRLELKGSDRLEYADEVFNMVKITYASIGVPASSASYLLKYSLWWVYLNSDGKPIAFNCFKETRFGLKSGLAGSDGTSEGKRLLVDLIRTKFKKEGIYGEVSHSVEGIALAAGAPVVPASDVPNILGKSVDVSEDGMHYTRNITNVGTVEKIMIGRPRGVDTITASAPTSSSEDDHLDRDAHLQCLIM